MLLPVTGLLGHCLLTEWQHMSLTQQMSLLMAAQPVNVQFDSD